MSLFAMPFAVIAAVCFGFATESLNMAVFLLATLGAVITTVEAAAKAIVKAIIASKEP